MALRKTEGGKNPLAHLDSVAAVSARKMLDCLHDAERRVREAISRKNASANADSRQGVFNLIRKVYSLFGKDVDDQMKLSVADAATDGADKAQDDAKGTSLVRFDMARAKRYWSYIEPENGSSLAAVFTDKMSRDLIDSLRRAVIEVSREHAVENLKANEFQKRLQDKWREISGDDSNFKFVDRSGKVWDNARYLQMLTRTTMQRIYNDAYADRMAESGFRYARISSLGAPDCKVCMAWQGQIVSLAGDDPKYPSVQDARDAGVFHPNCLCSLKFVDPKLEKEDLDRQAEAGRPKDPGDAEEMQRRKDEFDVGREMDATGGTREEAEAAVGRERVAEALRGAALDEESVEANLGKLGDAGLREMFRNGVPEFVQTRKGEDPGISRNGSVIRFVRPDDGIVDIPALDEFRKSSEESEGGHWKTDEIVEPLLNWFEIKHEPYIEDHVYEPQQTVLDMMESLDVPRSKKPLDLSETNPEYLTDPEKQDNCANCVVAAFLRLCGYDVVAAPSNDELSGLSAWKKNDKQPIVGGEFLSEVESAMSKWGDGSIAEVRIPLPQERQGHVVLAIRRAKETVLIDPQVGNCDNPYHVIKKIPLGTKHADSGWILRLDNNELVKGVEKWIVRNHKPEE